MAAKILAAFPGALIENKKRATERLSAQGERGNWYINARLIIKGTLEYIPSAGVIAAEILKGNIPTVLFLKMTCWCTCSPCPAPSYPGDPHLP